MIYTSQPLSQDTSLNQSIVSKIWSSAFCYGWGVGGGGARTTQIPPLNVKDRNYFISGPSPPFTQRVSKYLCEFMPSYCISNLVVCSYRPLLVQTLKCFIFIPNNQAPTPPPSFFVSKLHIPRAFVGINTVYGITKP